MPAEARPVPGRPSPGSWHSLGWGLGTVVAQASQPRTATVAVHTQPEDSAIHAPGQKPLPQLPKAGLAGLSHGAGGALQADRDVPHFGQILSLR